MPHKNTLYYFFAVLVMTIWSVTYVAIKVLLESLSPVEIMFYRFIIAYLVLAAIQPKGFKPISLKDELLYVGAGLTGGTLYYLAQNYALNYTSASNVGLLIAMAPVMTAVIAHFYTKNEKFKKTLLIGFAMAFIGSFLVIFNGKFEIRLNLLGDMLTIVSALCWAVYSIIVRKIDSKRSAIVVTRKIFFYSIIAMLPALPLSGYTFNLAPFTNPATVANLLFLALFASCACFLLWNKVIWALGAVKSSNFIYLSPLITLLSSWILLGEKISIYGICGGALILAGVYISENSANWKRARVEAA